MTARLRHRVAGATVAALLACTLSPAPPAEAKRIFVPRQYKKLQAAMDAATPGDTIWVAAGTYRGPFVMRKRMVLFGDGGPDSTILDGGDSARVLHIEGISRAGVLGFRIQRGKAAGGSGIYCLRDTSLIFDSCEIRSNVETGIALWQSTNVQINDCTFQDNTGTGLTLSQSRLLLQRTKFVGNRGANGGALSLLFSELLLAKDCLFDGNRAYQSTGGAIDADSSIVHVQNCDFRGNTSAVAGGAIASEQSQDTRIVQSVFTSNRAATGGAVLANHTHLLLSGSVFNRNRATAAGAAVQLLGRKIAGVNPTLSNNTFYRNGVDSEGAAIFLQDVSPEIHHNIFVVDSTAKNKTVMEQKSSPRYECNMLQMIGGTPSGLPAGTFAGDPLFCDPDKGDFHLRDLSPALLAKCGRIGALGKGCASFRLAPSQ